MIMIMIIKIMIIIMIIITSKMILVLAFLLLTVVEVVVVVAWRRQFLIVTKPRSKCLAQGSVRFALGARRRRRWSAKKAE